MKDSGSWKRVYASAILLLGLFLLPMVGATLVRSESTEEPTGTTLTEIIIDDVTHLNNGFYLYGAPGGWHHSGDARDVTYNGHAYWTYCADAWYGSDRNNWAQWRPNLPVGGQYRVSVYVPYVITGRPDTSQARYEIYYAGGSTVVTVDQNLSSAQWVYLGTWYFNAGTSGYVELEDITSDWLWYGQYHKSIKFDAMKFTLVSPSVTETPTPTRTPTFTPTPTRTRTPTPTPTLVAPTLHSISNSDCDGNYSVCWSSVGGATGYILEEDDNSSFSSPLTAYVGLDTCTTFSNKPPGVYYYRVRVVTDAGSSPWSNTRSVTVCPPTATPTPTRTPTIIPTRTPTPTPTVIAPTLYSISNPDCDGNYSVCWSVVSGATGYILEEDDNSGFSSPVTAYIGLDTCTTFAGRPPGIYYYRVRATADVGSSPWSNSRSVTVCQATSTPTQTPTITLSPTITPTSTPTPTRTPVPYVHLSSSAKLVDKVIADPGDTLQYTINLLNTGNTPAMGCTMQDILPVEVTFLAGSLSWTSGSASWNPSLRRVSWQGDVSPGNPVRITFQVVINPVVREGTLISNSATIADGQDAPFRTAPAVTRVGPWRIYLPQTTKSYHYPTLINGDFETGRFSPGWTAGGTLGYAVILATQNPEAVHGGNYAALLGNPSWSCDDVPIGEARMEQSITVPTTGEPILRFWYRVISQDRTTQQSLDQFDAFEVRINGHLILQDANMSGNYGCARPPTDLGWREGSYSLRTHIGQQITISLRVVNRPNELYNTWVYVDDITVK